VLTPKKNFHPSGRRPVPVTYQQAIRTIRRPPENLPEMDFLDGDVDFVRRLARGLYRAAGSA